jgi:hypothetical protein
VSSRGLQFRLFLTCWIVYGVHFATDFVREHYLVVSMVEQRTFDLTPYVGLHVDIFSNPPDAPRGGAHHGANPGISMVAAIPYLVARPLVYRIVARELASRSPGDTLAVYRDETRPRRLAFYEATRRMGLDVRFGLVGMITALFCMAPLAAASAVAVFRLLAGMGLAGGASLALSLAYAFATPTFFRASYLNQNLGIGVFSVFAFLLLWNPSGSVRPRDAWREVLAGALGGLCFLSDYSGAVTLAVLGVYLVWRRWEEGTAAGVVRAATRYAAGALPGILMLAWYQWESFGVAWRPPQHWMPPVDWIEVGYQGVGGPSAELFGLLLFDGRYGLVPSAPLLVLALAAPFAMRRSPVRLPMRELVLCYGMTLAYLLFFSMVQYTRIQWVTGIRYVMPVVPFLFLPAALVLLRIPRVLAFAVVAVSFVVTWSMTMYRVQSGVVDNVVSAMLQGVRLPALTTFSRMSMQYAPWLTGDASPWPTLAVVGACIAALWGVRTPLAPLVGAGDRPASGPGH